MLTGISISFLLLALLAEILGTIGGFGSSVFFVPIADWYFDFQSVLGLTALFHLGSNLSKILLFRKGLNRHLLVYIGIPSVVLVIVGGLLTNVIASQILEIVLGIFLIGLSSLFLIKRSLVITANKRNSIVGGSLSGFMAGLVGTGGAIRGLTMAAFDLEKSVFIATSAVIDLGIDLTRSVVYFSNGYMHNHDLKYVPFLIIIGLIGTYLGKRILRFVPQEKFRALTLFLIFCIGLITLFGVFVQ